MIIQKYCSKRMTGNVISARTIVREKKLKSKESNLQKVNI